MDKNLKNSLKIKVQDNGSVEVTIAFTDATGKIKTQSINLEMAELVFIQKLVTV